MTSPLTPPAARGSKLSQRLGRILLLAVVLVAVLGGWQLYQISLATRSFAVVVRPEPNPYGELLPSVLQPEDLLGQMGLQVALRDGTRLLELAPGVRTGALQTKGRAQRDAVEKVQLDARLRYPGSDPGRLSVAPNLEMDASSDTLIVTLSREAARRFLEADVKATFAIRTAEPDATKSDAVEGVNDVGGLLRPVQGQPGVYDLPLSADVLLDMLKEGDETYGLSAQDAQNAKVTFHLEVPLKWFLGQGESHVLNVERVVSDVAEVLPMVESFSPQHVVADRWDGRLTLHGRDLDLVEDVWLQGATTRSVAPVTERRIDALVVQPGTLAVGSYRIGISWRGQQQVVSGRLVVAAGFAVTSPVEGAKIVRGEALTIRWQSPPDAGEVVVEATSDPAAGAWLQIYRGDAAAGTCTWSTDDLTADEEGPLHLRVTWPGQTQTGPIERTVQVVAPAKIGIVLRFRLEGREYGMIQTILIDDEPVAVGDDPVLVPVRVEPGMHRIQARAPLLDPYSGTFEATHDGQIVDIELR